MINELSLPFNGPVSSPFGRRWLELPGQLGFWNEHEGCDWGRNTGTPVRAAGDGVVYDNVFTSLKGNQLGIQHASNYRTRYHMLRDKALFKVGQQVHAGDIIGYVGMSGTAATGPHLHFELHYNKKPINPTLSLSYNPAILAGDTSKPFPEGDDDMSQADIEWIKSKLQGIDNSISDPEKGVRVKATQAAQNSSDALAVSKNVEAIVASISNAINDPNTGIFKVTNESLAIVRELAKKANSGGVGAEINLDAIAKAVNDDAAKRMSS